MICKTCRASSLLKKSEYNGYHLSAAWVSNLGSIFTDVHLRHGRSRTDAVAAVVNERQRRCGRFVFMTTNHSSSPFRATTVNLSRLNRANTCELYLRRNAAGEAPNLRRGEGSFLCRLGTYTITSCRAHQIHERILLRFVEIELW